mmetsp:Transcript_28356/g.58057  ORF Transcript_28356/g.58057 Transcript_28356/m.58057 type:complete len:288 (-) Transcript_28356:130-993(-)
MGRRIRVRKESRVHGQRMLRIVLLTRPSAHRRAVRQSVTRRVQLHHRFFRGGGAPHVGPLGSEPVPEVGRGRLFRRHVFSRRCAEKPRWVWTRSGRTAGGKVGSVSCHQRRQPRWTTYPRRWVQKGHGFVCFPKRRAARAHHGGVHRAHGQRRARSPELGDTRRSRHGGLGAASGRGSVSCWKCGLEVGTASAGRPLPKGLADAALPRHALHHTLPCPPPRRPTHSAAGRGGRDGRESGRGGGHAPRHPLCVCSGQRAAGAASAPASRGGDQKAHRRSEEREGAKRT